MVVACSEPLREIRCLGSSCLSEGGIAYNIDSEGIHLPFSSNFERAEACMNSSRALRNTEVILRSSTGGLNMPEVFRYIERAGIHTQIQASRQPCRTHDAESGSVSLNPRVWTMDVRGNTSSGTVL